MRKIKAVDLKIGDAVLFETAMGGKVYFKTVGSVLKMLDNGLKVFFGEAAIRFNQTGMVYICD